MPIRDTLSLFVTDARNRVSALYVPSENASLYHRVQQGGMENVSELQAPGTGHLLCKAR